MRIGTPLTPSATRIMLLGAGELGKEVIIALQRLGVEVIAVDRYAHAPGHALAHRAHVLEMTDGAALRALITQERPHFVVPEIEAIATETLRELEAEGLTQVIPTAEAAWLTMQREGIRRLAAETLGLPTSRYAFADSEAALTAAITDGIGLPCVVKPVMSSSGKGQSVVRTIDEIPAAWAAARSGGRVDRGRVIAEQWITFDFEITLLTVRAIDDSGRVQTHFCAPIGHRQVDGDYVESWQPQPMSPLALERAHDIVRDVSYFGTMMVHVFDKKLQPVMTFGKRGNGPGEFSVPREMCVDRFGYFFVADTLNHRIQVFDTHGRLLRSWGTRGSSPGQLSYPYDVAIGPDGNLYVTSLPGGPEIPAMGANGAIYRIAPGTGAITRMSSGLVSPTGLAIGPDGTAYISMLFAQQILAVPFGGEPSVFAEVAGGPGDVEIADGYLYATEAGMLSETGEGKVLRRSLASGRG